MLTLLALLVGAAPAPHATLSAPPRPLISGRAWNATLVVKPAPRTRPKVVARPPSGRSLVFSARRVGRGHYKVRLVLPRAGRWTISARIGRRTRVLRKVRRHSVAAADLAVARRNCVPRVRRRARALPPVRADDRVRVGMGRLPRAACRAAHRSRHGPRPAQDRRGRVGLGDHGRRGLGLDDRASWLGGPSHRSRDEQRHGVDPAQRRACRTPGREAALCGRPTTRGRR